MSDLKTEEAIQLTDRLHATLKQIKPRQQFVWELKQKLLREAQTTQQQRQAFKQTLTWVAIGAGSLLYFGTVIFISAKSFWWVLSAIGALLGWRKAQPTKVNAKAK